MAYATIYTIEFKDLGGISWEIDIEQDGGSLIGELTPAEEPLRIEWENDSDDVFDPLKRSRALITVMSTSDFQLAGLYAVDNLEFRVKIYQNSVLYWMGFIETNNYSEPYEDTPYPVTLTAVCGLKYLKDILYDNAGTAYNGRRLVSQILIDVLGKLEYTGFTEYVNIYEESMEDDTDDSPMDQTRVDVDVFAERYCDEVLREGLKKFNACITHKAGTFSIYRPVELIGANVYGRIFTAVSTKSATSFAPVQYINRDFHVSARLQVPGGIMMLQPPVKKITINQDYGNKLSWLDNWELNVDTFDGTDFESWTQVSTPAVAPVGDYIPGEKDGVMFINDGYNAAFKFYQDMGNHTIESAGEFVVVEFEYGYYNTTASTVTNATFPILVTHGDYGLDSDDNPIAYWVNPSVSAIGPVEDALVGWSGWKTYRRQIEMGFNYNSTIRVMLASATLAGGVYRALKNFKFYATSIQILQQQKVRSVWQRLTVHTSGHESFIGLRNKYYKVNYKEPVDNIVQKIYEPICIPTYGDELDYDHILGDVIVDDIYNIIEQFAGSLASSQTRVDTITLTGTSGTCHVLVGGVTKTATWNTSLTQTATDFVTAFASFYDAVDITLTSSGANLIFTAQSRGVDFYNYAQSDYLHGGDIVNNVSGDLAGTIVYTTLVTTPSTDWNTYDDTHTSNAESKELLSVIGDEIASQTSRPKQLIQMPIQDNSTAVSAINPIGHFIDCMNSMYKASSVGMAGGNLIYYLYNNPGASKYTTFTSTGTVITSAIQTAAAASYAYAGNTIDVHDGDVLRVQFTLTLNSDELPSFAIYKGGPVAVSNVVQATAGANDFLLTITEDVISPPTGAVLLISNTIQTDFEVTEIFIGNNPRKFVFNRGEFSVKMRRWVMDLIEVIVPDDEFDDWFLPSKDELTAMKTNLHDEAVGDFADEIYWSSSEYDADNAYARNFSDGTDIHDNKTYEWNVRACRIFVSTDIYALRDTGPAGGLIFYITDLGSGSYRYYEAAPSDQSAGTVWSDIDDVACGATATAVGWGQVNTFLIVTQSASSAAGICDILTI